MFVSVGKEKVQFTLIFYLKQNKEVQLDLQRLEIFIFSSLLLSLPPGKMLEEKLTYRFSRFGICVELSNKDKQLTKASKTCSNQYGMVEAFMINFDDILLT